MNDDDHTPFDVDLETAYRQALRAVSATDLPEFHDWPRESGDTDEPADILRFPSPDEPTDALRRDAASPPSSPESVSETPAPDTARRVTPKQILEAALFVGGVELTAAKLAVLLKGDYTAEFVVRTLGEMNRRYADEGRPYEIRCEEGLFRLGLRADFEPLRRRVYGLGPREVKLTRDALEILSLIAYRQPISRTGIETIREGNAGNMLRQLVRRQLVELRREGDDPDTVSYVTTPRFLEVFGVTSLDELPRGDDRNFK
ncbi:MAG: SMC-Scp complex subunit ScpB [Planctomycetaceae bacterium]